MACHLVSTNPLSETILEYSITGDPLHSRAHCSPGARLCEQWGHGCVNNGARLCASARLCRGSPVALLIRPLGTNFNEILIEIHTFSFKNIHLKMFSGKWRPFCLSLNVLSQVSTTLLKTDHLKIKSKGAWSSNELQRCHYMTGFRADSRLAPSQWEMSLQSNAVSHLLGANLESALQDSRIVFVARAMITMQHISYDKIIMITAERNQILDQKDQFNLSREVYGLDTIIR